jgi:hypothetical protein
MLKQFGLLLVLKNLYSGLFCMVKCNSIFWFVLVTPYLNSGFFFSGLLWATLETAYILRVFFTLENIKIIASLREV